ncbi:MAG TPA: hypothetical protein VFZ53_13100 [Polyangiaceae bacterium]
MLAAGAWLGGCAGPKFSAHDCDQASCAGVAGEAAGATSTGGSGTGGSNGGSANTGGSSPVGGNAGGTGVPDFPRFGVLDDFNRSGPSLGSNWGGALDRYELRERALTCSVTYCPAVFWAREFGVEQEVFATLVSFSNESNEINLVLKGQQSTECDLMEVLYSPAREELWLEACWETSWHTLGIIDISLEPGDQLGGRVGSDGFVDLFRNGVQVGRFDANDFPFIGTGGRIGANGVASGDEANVWDDFGGG